MQTAIVLNLDGDGADLIESLVLSPILRDANGRRAEEQNGGRRGRRFLALTRNGRWQY